MIWGDRLLKELTSDVGFRGGRIYNSYPGAINPASINVRLGNSFLKPYKFYESSICIILGDKIAYEPCDIINGIVYMKPGDFILATTMESFDIPIKCAAFVQGRSSIGRAALSVENAGFIDPGFKGHITLELKNDGPYTIGLKPGYPVAQIIFMDADDVENGYSGKYMNQVEATGSRMYMDDRKMIFNE